MKHLIPLRTALLSILLLAPGLAAEAAPMQLQFQADLVLRSNSPLLPFVFFGGEGVATVDVIDDHVNALSLPAGIFSTQTTAGTAGIEVRIDAANGAGTFNTGSGFWFGTMPILGNFRLCLGATCDASPAVDTSLPLGVVGAGGTTSTPGGDFRIEGNVWQTSTVVLSGPGFISSLAGYQSGPGGNTSSTALTGGFMLFVTPVKITLPTLGEIDFVAELGITFVPEPGAMALMAVGGVGLLLAVRRTRA